MAKKIARRHIRRGEIYYIDLGPAEGSIQGGNRPCVIIQNNAGNKNGPTVIVTPITSREKKKMITHVDLSDVPQLVSGSKAITEQIFTRNQYEVGSFVCTLDSSHMAEINLKLLISLSLNNFKSWRDKSRSSMRSEKSHGGSGNENPIPYEKMKARY